MVKRVYNRESADQIAQRTEWMTAGWIGSAISAISATLLRRHHYTPINIKLDWHLSQANRHLREASNLMRKDAETRKLQK